MTLNKLFILISLVGLCCFACTQESEERITEPILKDAIRTKSIIIPEPPAAFEDVLKVVEEMPLFGDCKTKECSDLKLIEYLYSNLEYPKEAKEVGMEGRVYIKFIIEKDGSVSNVHLTRGTRSALDEAALAVIKDLSKIDKAFQPGKQSGQKVKVMYTVPISFKLEGKSV